MFKITGKKFVAAIAVSALIMTTAGAAPPYVSAEEKKPFANVLATGKYSDVPATHDHAENIYLAQEMGILTGNKDGTFKPNQKLTRSNAVKALGKYILAVNGLTMEELDLADVKPFKDVPVTHVDKELYSFSLLVREVEVFSGDQNNNLLPGNLMSRQQMAKVLVETFGFEDLPKVESTIKDNAKASDDAYRNYINILSENGVTIVENFNPKGTTTRGQFASFLVRSVFASIDLEMQQLITGINEAATEEEMIIALDWYYLERVDMNLMPKYFSAMKDIKFENLEEIQAAIDAVNDRNSIAE